jgi:hypothetical protein
MKKIINFTEAILIYIKLKISNFFNTLITFIWNLLSSKKMVKFNITEAITILSIRSGSWRSIRNNFLEENPCCKVCGKKENLTVHHIIPFHVDENKELDPANLITLCQNKTMNCHFIFGHLLNWTKFNPNVIEDSKIWNDKLK